MFIFIQQKNGQRRAIGTWINPTNITLDIMQIAGK